MTDEEILQLHADKPVGTVTKVNEDGTCVVELDMSHPWSQNVFALGMVFGPEVANLYHHENIARREN